MIKIFLESLLPNAFLISSMLYIWYKLMNKKMNFKNYRLYICFFGIVTISIIMFYTVNSFVRIIMMTFILMIFFKYLFKTNINQSVITPIFYQVLLLLSEAIFALLASLVIKENPTIFLNSSLGIFISNSLIALISIILILFKPIVRIYKFIISLTNKIKNLHSITLSVIIIIVLNVIDAMIYYKIDFQYVLIFNISLIFVSCFIVLFSFKTQNKYNKVYDKYNIAINSLKDYENMMSKYKIANHENKNLLLTVRAMILNNEKDIPQYIDSIVEEKYKDDENLLFMMSSIPSGGLRGTIYSEILKIKESNINYSLNIDKDLRTIDILELETREIIDICKIIGVFVDNAIEAVKELKDKNISIDIFVENNNLNIKVTNNYKGEVDVSKIYDEGYTTKGAGHGYGLSLVKKITNENNMLATNIELSKNCFSHILIIKKIK